jgi:glycerophosphoryl diester phosphodiesterase
LARRPDGSDSTICFSDDPAGGRLVARPSLLRRSSSVTLVIAHRGASREARENTVAAFRRAVELGSDGIELDVRRSADGVLVVHHDALLDDGRAIADVAAADLPDHVPTLGAALDACAGAFVNVEIKNDPDEPGFDAARELARRTVDHLVARSEHLRWLISSFDEETVDACRRHDPRLRTAILAPTLDDSLVGRAAAGGHVAVHPWVGAVTAEAVRAAHAHGVGVNTWTCDEPDRMRELIAWGVDGICTNVPDVALAVRRSLIG